MNKSSLSSSPILTAEELVGIQLAAVLDSLWQGLVVGLGQEQKQETDDYGHNTEQNVGNPEEIRFNLKNKKQYSTK